VRLRVSTSALLGRLLYGAGSLSTANWLPSVDPQSGYQRIVTRTQAALATTGATLAGFLLYDGANDAALPTPAWAANWTTTLASLRTDLSAPTQPIIYSRLCPTAPASGFGQWAAVRSDQNGWQAATRYMVDVPDSGPFSDDHVHLTTEGERVHALRLLGGATALGV
jgi:hypothetical protein